MKGGYFYDTCALKHRYIRTAFSQRIRKVSSGKRWRNCIAELTVLEISGAFASYCREQKWDVRRFDTLRTAFLRDIATGQIAIIPSARLVVMRACQLMRFAVLLKGRHLKSSDALIASTCLELALRERRRIVFYTHDRKLIKTLREISAFRSALVLRYVDPAEAL